MTKSIQNIEQQDIESLIIVIENWLTLLCQMQAVQDNLYGLPTEINNLKKAGNLTNLPEKKLLSDRYNSLLSSLDREIPKLIKLEEKINNIIVLREVLEALQQKLKKQPCHKYELSFEEARLNIATSKNQPQTNINENKRSFTLYKEKIFKNHHSFWNRHINILWIFWLLFSSRKSSTSCR